MAEFEYLLRQDAQKADTYHSLYKLYFDNREYDKAWCVARTLMFLRSADTDQSNFYEQYKVASGNPSSRLTAQHWLTDLYHPDQDREVSMVFRSLCGPLFDSRYAAVTDKTTGLAKLKPVDFAKETASVAQAFAMSLQVLSPDVRPRLFLRSDMPYSLKSELVTPPATTCGMLLLRGYKPKDLQFITAHHLAYHRAEHYIRKMLPSAQELREALIVAMRSVGEGTPEAEKVWARAARQDAAGAGRGDCQGVQDLREARHAYRTSSASSRPWSSRLAARASWCRTTSTLRSPCSASSSPRVRTTCRPRRRRRSSSCSASRRSTSACVRRSASLSACSNAVGDELPVNVPVPVPERAATGTRRLSG